MANNTIESLYNEGNSLLKEGKFNGALTLYTKALEIEKNVKLLKARSFCYQEIYEFDLAIKDLCTAIVLDPENSELYHEKGLLTKNIEDFNKAILLDPLNIRAYNNRGNLNSEFFTQDLTTAINLCDSQLKIDLTNPQLYYYRGWAKNKLGKEQSALIDFSSAIEIDPHYIKALKSRCYLQLKLGKDRKALIDMNRILEIRPWDEEFYIRRSNLNKSLGNWQDVEKDLEKLVELKPNNSQRKLELGVAKRKTGKISDSIEIFTRAIEFYGSMASYCERALTHSESKNYDLAIEDMSHYIKEYEKFLREEDKFNAYSQLELGISYGNRAKFYMKRNDYNLAFRDLSIEIKIFRKISEVKSKYLRLDDDHLTTALLKRSAVNVFLEQYERADEDIKLYIELKRKKRLN